MRERRTLFTGQVEKKPPKTNPSHKASTLFVRRERRFRERRFKLMGYVVEVWRIVEVSNAKSLLSKTPVHIQRPRPGAGLPLE